MQATPEISRVAIGKRSVKMPRVLYDIPIETEDK